MSEIEKKEPGDSSNNNQRVQLHLRAIFEQAYIIAVPFLDPNLGLGGQPMVRHAYPALKEAFPQLTSQDISILVPALGRVFRERNRAA
jgi:hypothetical protein